jgi:hypothetical protein
MEGIIKTTGKNLPSNPSYGHICRRINNKLDINITNDNTDADDEDDYIIIAIEGTRIRVSNRAVSY